MEEGSSTGKGDRVKFGQERRCAGRAEGRGSNIEVFEDNILLCLNRCIRRLIRAERIFCWVVFRRIRVSGWLVFGRQRF